VGKRGSDLSPSDPHLRGLSEAVVLIGELDAGRLRVERRRRRLANASVDTEGCGLWFCFFLRVGGFFGHFDVVSTRRQSAYRASGPEVPFRFYDKVRRSSRSSTTPRSRKAGMRVVTPAVARRGAFVRRNVV